MTKQAQARSGPLLSADRQTPSSFIGGRIRDLRKAKGMSLQELSDVCDLSVGYLSQAERNIRTPSIDALHRISKSLEARISWFFANETENASEEDGFIVRKGNRWVVDWDDKMHDEVLSPTLGRQIQLLKSYFKPGAQIAEAYSHDGEKSGLILQGKFELWIGERHFILETGDSFAFESTIPHRYGNPSDEETIVIWVMTPPRL